MSLAKVRKNLKRKGISFREGEEFCESKKGAIWTWAEGEHPKWFDYYATDHNKFECGIRKTLVDQLFKLGYYAEWYDAGTIFIYEI